jgi:acyl-coenzyme A synthetase/AMP-(fatty) acid ligase
MVPAEIESALLEHPDVTEAVVAGAPDPRLGEAPVAWVRASADIAAHDLQGFVRERLAAYKVPVAVFLVDDFPRTDNGKVRKSELLKLLAR